MDKDFVMQLKDLNNTCNCFIEQMKNLWKEAKTEEEKQEVTGIVEKVFGATPTNMMWWSYFDREHLITSMADSSLTVEDVDELMEELNQDDYTDTEAIREVLWDKLAEIK